MTKELIELNKPKKRRIINNEAAALMIAQLTTENENLLLANRDCLDHFNVMKDDLAAAQAHIKALRDALENCRLFAARRRAEEWATHILRFCESGGSVANPLRQDDSALHERLKAERERCSEIVWRYYAEGSEAIDAAIRAMEDQ